MTSRGLLRKAGDRDPSSHGGSECGDKSVGREAAPADGKQGRQRRKQRMFVGQIKRGTWTEIGV